MIYLLPEISDHLFVLNLNKGAAAVAAEEFLFSLIPRISQLFVLDFAKTIGNLEILPISYLVFMLHSCTVQF